MAQRWLKAAAYCNATCPSPFLLPHPQSYRLSEGVLLVDRYKYLDLYPCSELELVAMEHPVSCVVMATHSQHNLVLLLSPYVGSLSLLRMLPQRCQRWAYEGACAKKTVTCWWKWCDPILLKCYPSSPVPSVVSKCDRFYKEVCQSALFWLCFTKN